MNRKGLVQKMKENAYDARVTGVLSNGFQGHIRYILQLPETVRRVHLRFTFDKREPECDPKQLRSDCRRALLTNMPKEMITEEMLDRMVKFPKGEINMTVAYQHAILGTAHRNELVKDVVIGPDEASEGFVPASFKGGAMEITLHCQNIVNEGTPYELLIEGSAR